MDMCSLLYLCRERRWTYKRCDVILIISMRMSVNTRTIYFVLNTYGECRYIRTIVVFFNILTLAAEHSANVCKNENPIYGFETAFLLLFLLFHLNYEFFFSVHPSSYFVSFEIKRKRKKRGFLLAISAYFLCVIIKHFIFHLTNVDFITSFFFTSFLSHFCFFLTIFAHLNNKIWEENKLHANFLSYPIILCITLHSTNLANIQTEKSRKISFIFLCNIYWYCVCML